MFLNDSLTSENYLIVSLLNGAPILIKEYWCIQYTHYIYTYTYYIKLYMYNMYAYIELYKHIG